MKDMEQIEELLNSYIDGELDERKSNEIKRLIDNDKEVFDFYDSLKRYKNLMDAVGQVPSPEGLCDSITKQLERQILLADTGIYSHRAGKRHLIVRRFMTVAAIIALAAVLSMIILDIFVPKSSRDKFFSNATRKQSFKQVLYEKPFPDEKPPQQDKRIIPAKNYDVPLVAVLTLQTESPIEVDWLVAKALTTTGLFNQTVAIDRQPGSVRYVLSCSNESVANLLAELSFVWPQCRSAKLAIGTEQAGKYITINNISAQQAMDVCRADNFSVRLRMAGDLAIINRAAAENIEKLYAIDNIDYEKLYSQKPALASTEKAQDVNLPATGDRNAAITIVVVNK